MHAEFYDFHVSVVVPFIPRFIFFFGSFVWMFECSNGRATHTARIRQATLSHAMVHKRMNIVCLGCVRVCVCESEYKRERSHLCRIFSFYHLRCDLRQRNVCATRTLQKNFTTKIVSILSSAFDNTNFLWTDAYVFTGSSPLFLSFKCGTFLYLCTRTYNAWTWLSLIARPEFYLFSNTKDMNACYVVKTEVTSLCVCVFFFFWVGGKLSIGTVQHRDLMIIS